jgi:hypothetical protein
MGDPADGVEAGPTGASTEPGGAGVGGPADGAQGRAASAAER